MASALFVCFLALVACCAASGWQGVQNASNVVIFETFDGCGCDPAKKTAEQTLCYFDYCDTNGTVGPHICNLTTVNGSLFVQYTTYGTNDIWCINGSLFVEQLTASGYNWTADDGGVNASLHWLTTTYNTTYPFNRCYGAWNDRTLQAPECVNRSQSQRVIAPGRVPVTPASGLIDPSSNTGSQSTVATGAASIFGIVLGQLLLDLFRTFLGYKSPVGESAPFLSQRSIVIVFLAMCSIGLNAYFSVSRLVNIIIGHAIIVALLLAASWFYDEDRRLGDILQRDAAAARMRMWQPMPRLPLSTAPIAQQSSLLAATKPPTSKVEQAASVPPYVFAHVAEEYSMMREIMGFDLEPAPSTTIRRSQQTKASATTKSAPPSTRRRSSRAPLRRR
jgi:hypothetical protein